MSTPIVATGAAVADRRAKRNVAVLVFAHAILGSQLAINIIVAGLAGALLADDPSLATLPISIVVVGSLLSAPAMSLFMGRYGRRAGFWVAALAGAVASALVRAGAVRRQLRVVHGGVRAARRLSSGARLLPFRGSRHGLRLLQAEGDLVGARRRIAERVARARDRARDLGYVSAVPYAGAYLAMIVLNVVGAVGLWFLDIPRRARAAASCATRDGRSLSSRASRYSSSRCCPAWSGFAAMSLVMTSTPLAMVGHGFTPDHAADVVRWHIVAMFAPSFFTGSIIVRFGRLPVIAAGLLLLGVCGSDRAQQAWSLQHFYLALVALGIGWNFSYIGATSLLGTTHTPAEQAKVQGLNDFLVLGFVAVGSFGSGALLDAFGWNAVQYAMAPALLVALIGVTWLALARRGASGV